MKFARLLIVNSSSTKYDSGTGWPSFWDCERGTVEKKTDNSFGMSRNEVHCAKVYRV